MADRDSNEEPTGREPALAVARAHDADVVVTERGLAVASAERALLDVDFDGLRRIQFDIERDRPATLVVVPHDPRHAPQMLTVPPEEYDRIAEILALVGRRLAAISGARRPATRATERDDPDAEATG